MMKLSTNFSYLLNNVLLVNLALSLALMMSQTPYSLNLMKIQQPLFSMRKMNSRLNRAMWNSSHLEAKELKKKLKGKTMVEKVVFNVLTAHSAQQKAMLI
jgi:hypothetical protein